MLHIASAREGRGEERRGRGAPTLVKDACFLTRNVFRANKARDFCANTIACNSAMHTWIN